MIVQAFVSGGLCRWPLARAARRAAPLAAALLGGAALAQSPLVIDPQQGATPRPLATPAPPPLPAPSPAPSPLATPQPPRIEPPAVRPTGTVPRAPTAQAPLPSTSRLPTPSGDPLAIDPNADPLLRLARSESSPVIFREAIAAAVVRNPAFDEAIADRDEAEAARNELRARNTPIVDLSLSSFKVIDRAFSNDPGNILERQRPDHRTDAIARVQQAFIDFGASKARVKAGNDRLLAAAAGIEDMGSQLALRAVAAWYNVHGYRTLVALGEAFASSQREVRGRVEERITQGVSAAGDLAQVDSYIASADTQLAEFRRSLASAEATFVAVTGAPPPADLGRAPVPDLSGISASAVTQGVDGLPTVRAANALASAARREARALWADLMPKVTLGVDAGRYGVFETKKDYDIRGNVTLNWRLGGGGLERRDQGFARAESAEARARRTREDAARDAEIAWADVIALEQARASIEQNYLASRRSRDVIAERFRVSRGTLFDVVAAESNYFSVAARYIQTVTELDTARYVLLARTGGLLPALGIDPGQWNGR